MKKTLALVLCAALLLAAPAALAAEFSVEGALRFTYPDAMTLDDAEYAEESAESYRWLCMVYDDTYVLHVYAEVVEDYADVNLGDISDEALDTLVQEELLEYEDYDATLQSMLKTDAGLPFYVLRMNDEGVVYYLACTVLNGCVFEFDFSRADGEEPDAGLDALMSDVIRSFDSELATGGNAAQAAE